MPSSLFRAALAALLLAGANTAHAQPEVETFGLRVTSASGVVTADNQGPADLGVVVTLPSGTETIDTSQTTIKTTVPPYSRVTLARIRPMRGVNPTAVDVAVGWGTSLGRLNASPRTDYPYSLPYAAGTEHRVTQGPDKPWFSHQGSHVNAIDFDLSEGTPIMAARSGVVVHTVDRYSAGGTDPEFRGKANNVYVEHADGTVAMYSHLRQGGVAVSVGQLVRAGDLLGYSGSTGYSNRPHLHFEVMRLEAGYNRLNYTAIPVQFQVEPNGGGTTVRTGQAVEAVEAVAPGGQVEDPTDPRLRAVTEEPEAVAVSVPVALEPVEATVAEHAVSTAGQDEAMPESPAPVRATASAPSIAPQESGGVHPGKAVVAFLGIALGVSTLVGWGRG